MTRRIVTGNDASGRSFIVSDGPADAGEGDPHGFVWREGERVTTWLPSSAPHLEPPRGGSHAMRIALPPWKEMASAVAAGAIPGLDPDGFHRTETIDYILMLDGEVELLLDDARTTVRPGDVVIQRNANHSWQNLTDAPVTFWGVMMARAE